MEASVYRTHPIELAVTDDLRRSRVTVLFRLLLALPHYLWVYLWAFAVFFAWFMAWVITLVGGRLPQPLHAFLEGFLRYTTHLNAYLYVVANPYPPFGGEPGYAVDLEVAPSARQNRWKTAFRLVLAIPAFVLASLLGQVLFLIAIGAWFIALFAGRIPRGLRDFAAYCLRYQQQTYGYLLFLTDRYPSLAQRPVETPPDTTAGS
jgi:hypothetical protein